MQLGGDRVSLRTSLARSLLAQPGNPCKDNNQRDYREMSRNGKTQKTSPEEEEQRNHLDLVNEHISLFSSLESLSGTPLSSQKAFVSFSFPMFHAQTCTQTLIPAKAAQNNLFMRVGCSGCVPA